MESENDLLNEDLFQSKHIVEMFDENHVRWKNKEYELDQHQNYTKRDYCHWMVNETDEP
jgi:hypothetical protein